MKLFDYLFKPQCAHEWEFHGWSYVKCKKCEKVEDNEELNRKLQSEFWERRVIPGHPDLSKEAINRSLRNNGRSDWQI